VWHSGVTKKRKFPIHRHSTEVEVDLETSDVTPACGSVLLMFPTAGECGYKLQDTDVSNAERWTTFSLLVDQSRLPNGYRDMRMHKRCLSVAASWLVDGGWLLVATVGIGWGFAMCVGVVFALSAGISGEVHAE
jgi:hypothetical protein